MNNRGLQTGITLDTPEWSLSITQEENLRCVRIRNGYVIVIGSEERWSPNLFRSIQKGGIQLLDVVRRHLRFDRNMTGIESAEFEAGVNYHVESFRHCGGAIIR